MGPAGAKGEAAGDGGVGQPNVPRALVDERGARQRGVDGAAGEDDAVGEEGIIERDEPAEVGVRHRADVEVDRDQVASDVDHRADARAVAAGPPYPPQLLLLFEQKRSPFPHATHNAFEACRREHTRFGRAADSQCLTHIRSCFSTTP